MSASALKTQMDTAAAANPNPWTTIEAAVEVLKTAVAAGATSGTTRTTAFSGTTSASGTVAAGAVKVTFIFSTDFVGSVKGVAIDLTSATNPFGSLTFAPNAGADTLDSIAWTRSAGTLYIQSLT